MKRHIFLAAIIVICSFFKLFAQPVLYGVAQNGGQYGYGTFFKIDAANNAFTLEKSFNYYGSSGSNPYGKLLYASNGMLYGTTYSGGNLGYGTLFEYDPQTETFTTKADFNYYTTGGYCYGNLTELENGDIVGTCVSGGSNGYGTIWKYEISSNTITKLKDFDYYSTGAYPYNGVTQASNGKLYGVTWYAGPNSYGTLYEFDPQNNSFSVLKSFNYSNGAYGLGKLVELDGKLYGVTYQGGSSSYGTIFEYDINNSVFATRVSFDYSVSKGAYPYSGLNVGSDGLIYGTNVGGGQNGNGILFSFDPNTGNLNNIHNFSYNVDGYPYNPVMEASDGNLYGMTYYGGNYYGSIYKYDIENSAYSTIHNFGYYSDGGHPFWSALTDLEGNNPLCRPLKVVKTLTNVSCNGATDGAIDITVTGATSSNISYLWSNGATTEDVSNLSAGNYSVKVTVNDTNNCKKSAYLKITQPDALTSFASATKVSFNGTSDGTVSLNVSGGTAPYTYLWSNGSTTEDQDSLTVGIYSVTVTDANGCQTTASAEVTKRLTAQSDLYGVAQSGGIYGNGTLFKLDYVTNELQVKKSFNYSSEGGYPMGKLLYASNGMLYGTTHSGGVYGYGTLFEYNPESETFTTKINFDYSTGAYSYGHLIQLDNGDIVGTSYYGGSYGAGTLWKYNISNNTVTKLYDFNYNSSGAHSYNGVTQASNGKLYGLTWYSGPNGYGTLYEFDLQTNTFNVKVAFNYSNGAYGVGKLVEVNGKLYGVTYQGGNYSYGTIFEYDITNNTFTTRVNFDYSSSKGAYPYVGLNQASNGLLYGTNISGGQYGNGILFSFDTQSGNINKVTDFNYGVNGYAYNPVMQASDGNLYGMTYYGSNYYGAIYKVDITANTSTTLQNFNYSTTGAYPFWTELTEIGQFAPVDPCTSIVATSDAETILCNGGSTTVSVSANGGTAPYTGTGDFTVTAGTYTYEVTDANGCTSSTTVTLSEPTLLTSASSAGTILCNGGSTTVSVSANGGTAPYTGTGDYTVTAGTYTYEVTDANGCTSSTTVTITEPTLLTSASSAGTILCNGGSTTVSVSANGGTAPYTGTGDFTVTAGTYTYEVTDANGCTSSTTVTVSEPTLLTSASSAGTILCNGGSTTVSVSANGGTAPYTGTGDFTVTAGTYSYEVTDANGCTSSTTVTVTEPSMLSASIAPLATSSLNTCAFGTDANIVIGYGSDPTSVTLNGTATGGSGAYTYSWSPASNLSNPNSSNPVFTPILTSGCANYYFTLTVTDANGCITTTDVEVKTVNVTISSNNKKVKICHANSTVAVDIEISVNAVPTHLGHGDCLGSCTVGCSNYAKLEMEEDITDLGVLDIYPNPNDGTFTVEFVAAMTDDATQIIIEDVVGRQIFVRELSGEHVHQQINLQSEAISNIATGIYFVKVINGGDQYVKKINISK